MDVVRIGVLGASRIAPSAVIAPARTLPEAQILGVAARDRDRARAFALEHDIPKTYDNYDALLADPEIDAVYNPLPNNLHGRWTIAAVEAGKHVLCEKPFAANAEEARLVDAIVKNSDADHVVMEGMHYRYHPLALRMVELAESGVLGRLRHVGARMVAVVPRRADMRYRFDAGGGATMDVGCYAIHQIRTLARSEPAVTNAQAKMASPDIDRWMRAQLEFDCGATGRMTCALWSGSVPITDVRVDGEEGQMRVLFPNRPQLFGRVFVRMHGGSTVRERITAGNTSFWYQLRAFCRAVLQREPPLTPTSDAVANMRVIDAVYEAAGLTRREPSG